VLHITNLIEIKTLTFKTKLLIIFTFFSFCVITPIKCQNKGLDKKIIEIDSLMYAHLGKLALPIIDSLISTSISDDIKLYLKANKVEALVHLEDYKNALPFANKLLKNPKLQGEALMKTYIERALLYEVSGKMKESKNDLDSVGDYYKNLQIKKDELYGEYLYRLSSWFRISGDLNKSITLSEKAIQFGNQNNYGNVEATGLLLLATTKYNKQINKKEELFKRALSIWKKCNNYIHINFMYRLIAGCYVTQKNNNIVHKYLDSSIVAAKKINYHNSLSSNYRFKSSIYEKEKNYKKALEYFKNYQTATEKDVLGKQKIEVQKIEAKYNFEKAEQLTKKIEIKRKNTTYILILICSILAITALSLRVTKQKNKRIQAAEKDIKEKLKEKEFLFKELNHRVKNNLALILSLVKFQYYEIDEPKYKDKFKSLEHRINTIASAHEQLLYNEENIEGENYDTQEYLSKITNSLLGISTKDIQLNLEAKNINLNIDTMLPIGILINELMSNSIKHATFKNELIIDINITLHQTKIDLTFKDSGTSFIETRNTKSLGLSIINSMIKQLKGTINRKQSEYYISLQLKN
jgi:two-component sensor histidine kinase